MSTINITHCKQTIHYQPRPSLKLILDASEIIPDDPGQGTPAIVEWKCHDEDGRTVTASGTYWCVSDQGEDMDGNRLPDGGSRWLHSLEGDVNAWLHHHTQLIHEKARPKADLEDFVAGVRDVVSLMPCTCHHGRDERAPGTCPSCRLDALLQDLPAPTPP